jgi:hypothetical protein
LKKEKIGWVVKLSKYIVAGGIFKNEDGEERFDLICPAPGKPPYVLEEDVLGYFKLIWQDSHLYRVEDNYTLSLVVVSAKALEWGVKAPENVTLDEDLREKLKFVLELQ